MIYVARGFRLEQAFKSAMAYDIKTDKGIMLPDLAKERCDCEGAFQSSRFHVIGGRGTSYDDDDDDDGNYVESQEILDPVGWCWNPVQENGLPISIDVATNCAVGGNNTDGSSIYMCMVGKEVDGQLLIAREGSSAWQEVAKLPFNNFTAEVLVRWHDKMMMVGAE
ncbi:F-box/kelch-repeat protein At1g80440-like [Punica granatum]|uniref:F-box/kelch-repeat protein At1g80440-like n=1 Tax=Punica granatum TaxID=22663 RepID=A0A6P8CPP7_PUNGR|nr:F-box/kelch-repeat protein At1g80440-like [Punica granatum]